MANKTQNKTVATKASAAAFIAKINPPAKRADAEVLAALMKKITKAEPKMWGPTMVGFGSYHYKYESGREGDALALGFSPRAQAFSIYLMPGYHDDLQPLFDKLGKHKMTKACLYVKQLADIDMKVLEQLMRASLKKLKSLHKVELK